MDIERFLSENLNEHRKGILGKTVPVGSMLIWTRVRVTSARLLQLPEHTHTHTRLTALFPGLPGVSQYQKGKTSLGFTEARDSEWQVCISLQTDNHASTPPLVIIIARNNSLCRCWFCTLAARLINRCVGNESTQCWFLGLAISSAKIYMYFANKIYRGKERCTRIILSHVGVVGSVAEWLACRTQLKAWVQIAAVTLSGNSLKQTVHTHRASVHRAVKLLAALLRVVRATV